MRWGLDSPKEMDKIQKANWNAIALEAVIFPGTEDPSLAEGIKLMLVCNCSLQETQDGYYT